MNERFTGKVAVVTGGASGIGAATTRRLVQEGASVVLGDLQETEAIALAQELGNAVVPVVVDVTDLGAVEALMAEAVNEFGQLDVVFNKAGIGSLGRVDEIDVQEWHR